MQIGINTWEEFKSIVDNSPSLKRAVRSWDRGNFYFLAVPDSPFIFTYKLPKINTDDVLDFETNYKIEIYSSVNVSNDAGVPIVAPTIDETFGLYPKKRMYENMVVAGQINMFDVLVDQEKQICGGEYWIEADSLDYVNKQDIIEFSIIDKNDVLGLFSLYGLSVENGDVLEIVKFVLNDLVQKGDKNNGYHSLLFEGIKGSNKVYEGLFFRVMYDSFGTNNINFSWRLYFYE